MKNKKMVVAIVGFDPDRSIIKAIAKSLSKNTDFEPIVFTTDQIESKKKKDNYLMNNKLEIKSISNDYRKTDFEKINNDKKAQRKPFWK